MSDAPSLEPDQSTVAAVLYLSAKYRAAGFADEQIRRRVLDELGKPLIARATDEHTQKMNSAKLERTVEAALRTAGWIPWLRQALDVRDLCAS